MYSKIGWGITWMWFTFIGITNCLMSRGITQYKRLVNFQIISYFVNISPWHMLGIACRIFSRGWITRILNWKFIYVRQFGEIYIFRNILHVRYYIWGVYVFRFLLFTNEYLGLSTSSSWLLAFNTLSFLHWVGISLIKTLINSFLDKKYLLNFNNIANFHYNNRFDKNPIKPWIEFRTTKYINYIFHQLYGKMYHENTIPVSLRFIDRICMLSSTKTFYMNYFFTNCLSDHIPNKGYIPYGINTSRQRLFPHLSTC